MLATFSTQITISARAADAVAREQMMRHGFAQSDFARRLASSFAVWRAACDLAAAVIPLSAQSQRKTPAKPPASSSSQEKEDPLAPLLQQAKDAIDKMDFAAALDPLQKYIAQRPDDPYAHFQLGYAYAGLKRPEDAKAEFSRAIALDPKMAAALLESRPGADG